MRKLKSVYADLGIRTKLILLLVLVGPVPMATASFLSYNQASGDLADKAGTEQAEVAFNAIDKLDRNIQAWMDTTMGGSTRRSTS